MFKMLSKKKKENKGFTLVELVVVVAILAILVGLLAPQYTKYVEKSRKASDAANMDEMVRAVQIYAADPDHEVTEITGAKIVIGESGVTAENSKIKDALEGAGLNTSNIKRKSSNWGDTKDPTATISIDSEGNVTVSYAPANFETYMKTGQYSGAGDN